MGKPEAVIVGVADLPLKDGRATQPMSVLQAQAMRARDALADAGTDDFVAKPVDARRLERAIRRTVNRRKHAS